MRLPFATEGKQGFTISFPAPLQLSSIAFTLFIQRLGKAAKLLNLFIVGRKAETLMIKKYLPYLFLNSNQGP